MSKVISNYEPSKQYGWVCPKCGAVMSPYQSSCIYCIPPAKPICGDYTYKVSKTGDYIDKNTTTII